MVVTGPVGKHFGNLESYPVHNQIHGLVLIESKSLVLIYFCAVQGCEGEVASLYIYIRRRRMRPAGRDKSGLPDIAFKVDTNIEFRLPPQNKSTGNRRYGLFYWFIIPGIYRFVCPEGRSQTPWDL